jgi:hypothetical protein
MLLEADFGMGVDVVADFGQFGEQWVNGVGACHGRIPQAIGTDIPA